MINAPDIAVFINILCKWFIMDFTLRISRTINSLEGNYSIRRREALLFDNMAEYRQDKVELV